MAGEATRAAHTQKLAAVESGADAVDEGEEGGAGAVKNGGGEVLHGKGVLIVDPVGGAGGGDAVGVVTEGAGASAIDGALGKGVGGCFLSNSCIFSIKWYSCVIFGGILDRILLYLTIFRRISYKAEYDQNTVNMVQSTPIRIASH